MEELKRKAAKVDPELRDQEVKASDEEKMTKEDEQKEKEARAAAGSSKDGPKKDPKKSKKEEKKKEKKRKPSSSSEIERLKAEKKTRGRKGRSDGPRVKTRFRSDEGGKRSKRRKAKTLRFQQYKQRIVSTSTRKVRERFWV